MPLAEGLVRFFEQVAPLGAGDRLQVAFSGGPDSLALLAALVPIGSLRTWQLEAVHVDHQLDSDSSLRAAQARSLAQSLGVAFRLLCASDFPSPPLGSSPEEAARWVRYLALESAAESQQARWTATAHHRDDQVDTVLLRWLQGSGIWGLRGMEAVHGRIVRPCLEISRRELLTASPASPLRPVDDPANRDLRLARNRVTRALRPVLEIGLDNLDRRITSLAEAAGRAERWVEKCCLEALEPDIGSGTLSVERQRLASLPAAVLPHAIRALHQQLGARRAARATVIRELVRQLGSPGTVGCHCGDGWHWTEQSGRLYLTPRQTLDEYFEYTLEVPGEVYLPELNLQMSLRRGPAGPWIYRGSPSRVAFDLGERPPARATVRNRRPGDRLRPLGFPGSRKLKDLLIDRKIPRSSRSRIPLLCLGEQIVWVPGVALAEDYRVTNHQKEVWIAQIKPVR